jgi:hypothetical protein
MFGCERSEWRGKEDAAQGDQLVPAASRADIFSTYKNSGDKVEQTDRTDPEIC